jgi:hypothetical protein
VLPSTVQYLEKEEKVSGPLFKSRSVQYPNNLAADERATRFFYDWRNRLVASKSGVDEIMPEEPDTQRLLIYREYDNLSQVVLSEQYDGDAVSIVDSDNNGVPDQPDTTKRRARSTSSFDEQGRVYRTQTFSVNQSDGTISTNSLTSNTWYDRRGNVIKKKKKKEKGTRTYSSKRTRVR